MPKKFKTFKMLGRIKNVYDKRFANYYSSFAKFQKAFYSHTDSIEGEDKYNYSSLGTSPFETKAEFEWFKKTHKFSDEIRNRLRAKYYSDYKERKEQFIDDMELRALAVLGGGYTAARAEMYRENILKTLDNFLENKKIPAKDRNPMITFNNFDKRVKEEPMDTTFIISKLDRLGVTDFANDQMPLKQFRSMIANMDIQDINLLSSMKEIAPDFRAYGSSQEDVNQPELKNISFFLSQLTRGTERVLLRKYAPTEIQKSIIYRTLPQPIREKSKGKSLWDLKVEMVWDRFKRGTLYNVRKDGSVYMRFISRAEEPDLQKEIDKRYAKEYPNGE